MRPVLPAGPAATCGRSGGLPSRRGSSDRVALPNPRPPLPLRPQVELQQLCDKVPSFDNELAMQTIREELQVSDVSDIFSEITPAPVAAASLGQVYRAKLRSTGEVVAVKVQRPYVLETVSLDLHLARELGLFLRRFPALSKRLDLVDLLDEFGSRFYAELDYVVSCRARPRPRVRSCASRCGWPRL